MTRVSPLRGPLRKLLRDLEDAGVRSAVLGGIAVSARTDPRFTRDIALAVAVENDTEAEALVRYLVRSGYQLQATLEQGPTGRLVSARLTRPDSPEVFVDLLFASSGIEAEIVAESDEIDVFEGVTVRVASVGHLIATKLLSRSEERLQDTQDTQDLVSLTRVATVEDIARARAAIALMEACGFARGRDLARDLAELCERFGVEE